MGLDFTDEGNQVVYRVRHASVTVADCSVRVAQR